MKMTDEQVKACIARAEDEYDMLKDRVHEQYDELKQLNRQIKIKDNYCQAIINIGYDYDGYNTVEGLKKIIDELVSLAQRSIDNDDKSGFYVGDGKEYNVLMEEIGEVENLWD